MATTSLTYRLGWKARRARAMAQLASHRLRRRTRGCAFGAGSVLVMPPSGPGSLGDQAMLQVMIEELRRRGAPAIGLLQYGRNSRWEGLGPLVEEFDILSALEDDWDSRWQAARAMGRFDHFMSLGADVLDGAYSDIYSAQRSELVDLASQTGAKTRIVGFSCNAHPGERSVLALRKLPGEVRMMARDAVSLGRLQALLPGRPLDLVADLAFLLRPDPAGPIAKDVIARIQGHRLQGRCVLGVNINLANFPDYGPDRVEGIRDGFVRFLKALLRSEGQQVSVLLIPHDIRPDAVPGKMSDDQIAIEVFERLDADVKAICEVVPMPCPAEQIKAIAGELDLVVTGRMHLAIAALGQATPALALTYQGKFDGLFQHFSLEGLVIEPNAIFDAESTVAKIRRLLGAREELRTRIAKSLPRVHHLAGENFSGYGRAAPSGPSEESPTEASA